MRIWLVLQQIVAALAFAACGESGEVMPDAPVTMPDATCSPRAVPDDGFDLPCVQDGDGNGFSECTTATCAKGSCAITSIGGQPRCRRFCQASSPRCPAEMLAVPVLGRTSDDCICVPHFPWLKYKGLDPVDLDDVTR